MITRKRIGWGALWSEAPWDGKRREPTPIQIPATLASRVAVNVPMAVGAEKRGLAADALGPTVERLAMGWATAATQTGPRNRER